MRACSASVVRCPYRNNAIRTGAYNAKSLASGMALLAAAGLGGGLFLVTASAKYAGLGALAGLLIGAGLHSETGGA